MHEFFNEKRQEAIRQLRDLIRPHRSLEEALRELGNTSEFFPYTLDLLREIRQTISASQQGCKQKILSTSNPLRRDIEKYRNESANWESVFSRVRYHLNFNIYDILFLLPHRFKGRRGDQLGKIKLPPYMRGFIKKGAIISSPDKAFWTNWQDVDHSWIVYFSMLNQLGLPAEADRKQVRKVYREKYGHKPWVIGGYVQPATCFISEAEGIQLPEEVRGVVFIRSLGVIEPFERERVSNLKLNLLVDSTRTWDRGSISLIEELWRQKYQIVSESQKEVGEAMRQPISTPFESSARR